MNCPLVVSSFEALLFSFRPCFTKPSAQSFLILAAAWVLATGKRTVTGLIRAAGRAAVKSHDAYQYFFSHATWEMADLWRNLFGLILRTLCPEGVVRLAADDTLLHHCGRKIFGVGVFRDAVRTSLGKVAYGHGHNWVVLCVVVPLPFLEGRHVALPVGARLRVKGEGPTLVELLEEMVHQVASWAPDRTLRLLTDGGFASLVGSLPDNVQQITRLRKDAALFGPKPPRTGKPGRPRKKGKRLPSPKELLADSTTVWSPLKVTLYGETLSVLVHSFVGLWYSIEKEDLVRVVLVRDPSGANPDTILLATDVELDLKTIIEDFGLRWSIEVVFREAKQSMGIQGPQARLEKAVRRQAPFAFLLQSLVKLWYVSAGHELTDLHSPTDPWYEHREGMSFHEMLTVLRRASWGRWISTNSASGGRLRETVLPLVELASRAA